MRFRTVNLGCKVNRVESDAITAKMLACGGIKDDQNPEVVIINTCAVTGEAEKKTRKAVSYAIRTFPHAMILVTGCAAALDAEEFEQMSTRVQVVGKAEAVMKAFAQDGHVLQEKMHENTETDYKTDQNNSLKNGMRFGDGFPTRVGIKVQDGCDNACTYCIVHVARGKACSLPMDTCIAEARRLADAGAHEAVITGINLGSYDDHGADLADLLLRMRQAVPSIRLRTSSIEPLDIDDHLIDVFEAQQGWICRHLHLPLQSGSSRVLEQMGRPYDAQEFESIVDRVRSRIPHISFSTDIIVGFPGETDDDFEQTMDIARRCGFAKIHVFRYSKRRGTPAAERSDQVDPHIIARRSQALQELAAELRMQQAQKRIGTIERVLVESGGMGMTESYFPIRLNAAHQRGSLIECTLTEPDEDGIFSL